jgi:hypothetical protein
MRFEAFAVAYNHIVAFWAVTPCACWYSHSGGKQCHYIRDGVNSCSWSYDPLTSRFEYGTESNSQKNLQAYRLAITFSKNCFFRDWLLVSRRFSFNTG